jgi:hypothetical protein
MTELADILPKTTDGVTVRRARVIEAQGSSLLVDMGGGITVARLDSCNPLPGQQVYIISEGSSMTAIADRKSVAAVYDHRHGRIRDGCSRAYQRCVYGHPEDGRVHPCYWRRAPPRLGG